MSCVYLVLSTLHSTMANFVVAMINDLGLSVLSLTSAYDILFNIDLLNKDLFTVKASLNK